MTVRLDRFRTRCFLTFILTYLSSVFFVPFLSCFLAFTVNVIHEAVLGTALFSSLTFKFHIFIPELLRPTNQLQASFPLFEFDFFPEALIPENPVSITFGCCFTHPLQILQQHAASAQGTFAEARTDPLLVTYKKFGEFAESEAERTRHQLHQRQHSIMTNQNNVRILLHTRTTQNKLVLIMLRPFSTQKPLMIPLTHLVTSTRGKIPTF